jgi:hypothetical protein
MKLQNLIGRRFGMLVVLCRDKNVRQRGVYWQCLCDCGNLKSASGNRLRIGQVKSCGCQKGFRSHGMTHTTEYCIWQNMMARCYSQKHTSYRYYGGRGITVCARWHVFENFFADVGKRPDRFHTIDRIRNDGPYAPDNWRWATRTTQARNSRRVRMVTIKGVTKPLTMWAEQAGLWPGTLWTRLKREWPMEKLLQSPKIVRQRRPEGEFGEED